MRESLGILVGWTEKLEKIKVPYGAFHLCRKVPCIRWQKTERKQAVVCEQ